MAVFNGTLYKVQLAKYDANGSLGAYSDANSQTEGSISLSMETRDTTTKSSLGYRSLLEGLRSASLSLSGLVDDTNSAVTTLTDQFSDRLKVAVKFGIDGGDGEDDDFFSCDAYVTSIEVSAGTEDNVTYSASLEVTGAITHDSTDDPE